MKCVLPPPPLDAKPHFGTGHGRYMYVLDFTTELIRILRPNKPNMRKNFDISTKRYSVQRRNPAVLRNWLTSLFLGPENPSRES